MITLFRMISAASQAWVVAVFFFAVSVLYFAVCFLFPKNRIRAGRRNVVINYLLSGATADILWSAVFFSGGDYINRGLGISLLTMLAFPALLLLSGGIVTVLNRKIK